jgi:hypothetical protein
MKMTFKKFVVKMKMERATQVKPLAFFDVVSKPDFISSIASMYTYI